MSARRSSSKRCKKAVQPDSCCLPADRPQLVRRSSRFHRRSGCVSYGARTPWITHVMQTVEACHEVEAFFPDVLGVRLPEAYAIAQPMCDGVSSSLFNGT